MFIPRPILADAYTICSSKFESNEALERSVYYGTYRTGPSKLDNNVFEALDDRIVFCGLGNKIRKIFSEPITHSEIDISKGFLRSRKITTSGLADFDFPEEKWREIVDKYNGRMPITIMAMPEGSVVYPHEPAFRVVNTIYGYGWLSAAFESTLMKCWAVTERVTTARHWLLRNQEMIAKIEKDASPEQVRFLASLMMHDFGDRAAATDEESQELGEAHLYCFPGTDTFQGAYAAWVAGAIAPIGSSVWALAHRIVQGFIFEKDCYVNFYNKAPNNSILSMVGDCYDYYNAVENYMLPLAKRSIAENNGKVIVARPDSGNPLEQVLWTIELAIKNGLYTTRNGFKYGTTLKFIEGDSMDFETMNMINRAMIMRGYAPHGWGLYGVGGHLRNSIRRDNLSSKYALCAVGSEYRPVIKISHTQGKGTLPMTKILRDEASLKSGKTIVLPDETGEDAMIKYVDNGSIVLNETFPTIQRRILDDFEKMPLAAGRISDRVLKVVNNLVMENSK